MGKLTFIRLIIWNPKLHARSTQVSEFFEPSIKSTVDVIQDKFSKRLTNNSVRTLDVS